MTGTRYLLLAADEPGAMARCRERLSACAAAAPLRTLVDERSVLLLAAGPVLSSGAGVFVLGSLFTRGSAAPVPALDPADWEAVLQSRGKALAERFWGGHVVLIRGGKRDTLDIARSPLGELPVLFSERAGVAAVASDMELLEASGACTAVPDWVAIARHLAASDIRGRRTCLVGVRDLYGGERLTIGRRTAEVAALWTPWDMAAPERQIADRGEAARRVRDAALLCVGAHASGFPKILLKLSGGLDSSIVAACLARLERPFACMTLVTKDPSGDERGYARIAASACGAPLIERYRELSTIRLDHSAAAGLPRPVARSFAQESTRLAGEVARETGAAALFDGGGGDNVFCSLQSARPIVDQARSGESLAAVLRTAGDIARLSQASLWAVVRRALLARWHGLSAYPWSADYRLLSREALAVTAAGIDHPWLRAPPEALPGKAAQVALIAAAQSVVEGSDPRDALPSLSPLISQPLVEACLRVPSWMWFSEGLNRAVARGAFAGDLPPSIVQRRSKGAPDSFVAEIFETNRATIFEMLMEGELARAGVVDRSALAAELLDEGPVRGHMFVRIMQLLDAEVWARSWLTKRSAAS